jgi:hypothetical protein
MNEAIVSPDKIPVRYQIDGDREFITFDIPNGWDDVKKLCKKVLEFDGRNFEFSCWNSDKMTCVFYRMLNGPEVKFAKIKR